MKRFLPVLGALVLVAGVVAVVALQRPDAPPSPESPKPVVLQYANGTELWRTGQPETPLVRQVFDEAGLSASGSLTLERLSKTGATVVTTIDAKAQAGATAVLADLAGSQPSSRTSITAVDPANGRIRAYAPGNDPAADYAGGVLKEPGTAFFPFNVATALEKGRTLDTAYDGRSPRKFLPVSVTVADNANCGERCTLRDALLKSSNVAMYELVLNDTGQTRTVKIARQAGVPELVTIDGKTTKLLVSEDGGPPSAGVGLGASEARMRPLDLAASYATFAAEGVHNKAHFVTHISDFSGNTLYRAVQAPKPAFDVDPVRNKEIAKQVTDVLKADPACGENGFVACRPGVFEAPGSPGQISHAWMVAYDSQVSVSVFAGSDQPTMPAAKAALPKEIWLKFKSRLQS